jgi:hypothetical protein
MIQQALAGALAAKAGADKKGIAMSQKFMLRNDKNEEVEVTADQLAAAGIRVVPEGSTVLPTTEVESLLAKVTSLSDRLDQSEAQRIAAEVQAELDRLSNGGFITKPQRDFALAQWGTSTDLTLFKAWAATFTTPVVTLSKEHGAGSDAPAGTGEPTSEQKIIDLSNKLVKERGLSLREAVIVAGKELAGDAKTYLETVPSF